MAKPTLPAICADIKVSGTWRDFYRENVPLFIQTAARGVHWEEWDEDVFHEYFMQSSGQCVSSLRQGNFTNQEKERIKEHWDEVAPLLQKIACSQEKPLYDVYNQLEAVIRQYTDSHRRAATYRMVAGLQPQLLCTIVNHDKLGELVARLRAHVADFQFEWMPSWFENSHQMLQYFKNALKTSDGYEVMTYPWQVYEEWGFNNDGAPERKSNDMSESKAYEICELLKYKKQIILQGPPGTGKTRLAKEVASLLTGHTNAGDDRHALTKEEIVERCSHPVEIPTAKTSLKFKITGVTNTGVRVVNSAGSENTPLFPEIIRMYDNRAWEREGLIVNGTHSYSAAVAKYIDACRRGASVESDTTGQCTIVQFHPSYGYEDFVRGIVAKPNLDGEGILYEAENKILASFAKEALTNYRAASVSEAVADGVEQSKSNLDRFVTHVVNIIDRDGKYPISDNVYFFYVDDKRFKYKGDNWEAHPKGLNMNFSELEKIIAANISERNDIVQAGILNALTRSHATYYANVLQKYNSFIASNPVAPTRNAVALRNYVLIIDEINRANLSSVFGELIYALEYRGEGVVGMYAVEEDNQLILPPNLYIIGTMNTADRSVGHIDYAIRRRFAFVPVMPHDLSLELGAGFHKTLFDEVAALFRHDLHLSGEFHAQDVQLGHSYFIDKADEGGSMEMRLAYEIKPILHEYIKDGILIGEGIVAKIDALSA